LLNKLKWAYPFILALTPVLNSYRVNFYEIAFFKTVRSMLIISLITLIVLLLLDLLLKNPQKARICTLLVMVVLVNLGAIYSFFDQNPVFGVDLSRLRYLLPLISVMSALVLFLVFRFKKIAQNLDLFFCFASIGIVIIFIASFLILISPDQKKITEDVSPPDSPFSLSSDKPLPNIYHIVLDGYTSSEVLQNSFNYDNSGFEEKLLNLGFQIPENAYSNYDETTSSLGSILNMDFVQSLLSPEKPDPKRQLLINKMVNGEVRKLLSGKGYHIVAFENDYLWSLWKNADYYMKPETRSFIIAPINPFELIALNHSFIRIFINKNPYLLNEFLDQIGHLSQDKYVEQTYILENLARIPKYLSPMFVYAHATITHVPFIFEPDGTIIAARDQGNNESNFEDENIRKSYVSSLQYMNLRLIPILEEIIKNDPDSIIILHGDHGYPGRDRNSIFFATYDPQNSIESGKCFTPVNLYRYIFNNWFGADYSLLPNELYKITTREYYQFESLGTCENMP